MRLAAAVMGVVLLLAGCSASGAADPAVRISPTPEGKFRGTTFVTPHPRPHFTLTDQTGRPYDFGARTRGVPTLLYFGYTHCPDICPTIMADLATALRQAGPDVAAKVRVVFVTTDPRRDTPKVLTQWLANFDAELPAKFTGLTGPQAEIDQAQRSAGVTVAEDSGQTHSTQILLYGPDDVARVFFLEGTSPDDIAHDLPIVAKG